MKRTVLALAAALVVAAPAAAQDGLALKGHFLFNESTARDGRDGRRVPLEDGISIGAEYVLPFGLGVGVTAYREGEASDVNFSTDRFGVLAEANYFFRLPVLPIRPYVGVHAGLGQHSITSTPQDGSAVELQDGRTELGFQAGLRWQVLPLLGVDAQYRRVSDSAGDSQVPELERSQVLVGVTLF